jgi:hypothetical protein
MAHLVIWRTLPGGSLITSVDLPITNNIFYFILFYIYFMYILCIFYFMSGTHRSSGAPWQAVASSRLWISPDTHTHTHTHTHTNTNTNNNNNNIHCFFNTIKTFFFKCQVRIAARAHLVGQQPLHVCGSQQGRQSWQGRQRQAQGGPFFHFFFSPSFHAISLKPERKREREREFCV